MMRLITLVSFLVVACCLSQCKQPDKTKTTDKTKILKKRIKPAAEGYRFEKTTDWVKQNHSEKELIIVAAVNRTDSNNIGKMDSIIVPKDLSGDLEFYLPFPISVPFIEDIQKIIFFSYPTQSFAAYEAGELVYAGQTNMGRKTDPTATGLFYTNWKAEQTTSTFNDEWELKWNFNIANELGIGFHQYELPGFPASHSCLRLTEKDAMSLYNWADEWVLYNPDSVLAKGTPVIVFGAYPFDGAKPWLQLVSDAHALDILSSTIQQQVQPFKKDILFEQQKRATTPIQ
jgi:hypothetical protein